MRAVLRGSRRLCASLQSAVLQRTAAQRDRWRAEITVDGVAAASPVAAAACATMSVAIPTVLPLTLTALGPLQWLLSPRHDEAYMSFCPDMLWLSY